MESELQKDSTGIEAVNSVLVEILAVLLFVSVKLESFHTQTFPML